jgi:hypothetical protein
MQAGVSEQGSISIVPCIVPEKQAFFNYSFNSYEFKRS